MVNVHKALSRNIEGKQNQKEGGRERIFNRYTEEDKEIEMGRSEGSFGHYSS